MDYWMRLGLKYLIAGWLLCFFFVPLKAQEEGTKYISPFDFSLKLSANFGELRSGHLHGGLDIKTEGVVGKAIHCVADGYVSRATVSYGGFGQALYITHPNGFTSVYGHISRFAPAVEKVVEAYQYKHETFQVDLRFEPNQINYKAGDIIAFSGNEGFSFGPHLHMELHADDGRLIDPMPYFKNYIVDTTPPRATGIKIYPQCGEGVVNGSRQDVIVPLKDLGHTIQAWGKIAFGLCANDYMDGTANNYGVKYVTLMMDTTEIFKSAVEEFTGADNRGINAWTDYKEHVQHNRWVMRSHILPGNKLPLLKAKERGIVTINEDKDYNFMYILEDGYGNKTTYRFTVHGLPQEIEPYTPETECYLSWNQSNIVQEPGMELMIPRGMLYDDIALKSKVLRDSSAVSFTYQLHDEPVPMNGTCKLMIGVRHLPVADTAKYYIARKENGRVESVGGTYADGWVSTNISELGTYTIAIDTIGPKVTPRNRGKWSAGAISFHVSDKGTGVKNYRVTIDGKFALFGYNAKNAILSNKRPDKIKRGMKHEMVVSVTDHCGNETVQTYTF